MKKCFAVLLLSIAVSEAFAQEKDLNYYISHAPFKMPEVTTPSFPEKSFIITDFGAIADGQILNTNAIAATIAACEKAGGGTVTIPPGLWLTGPIELKSNINLHAERGA
ncbi:MAG TPA: glycoside hydrolase family 28 protein, partial [Chitinophagaceae bacterium]|nr:glycoside hydrolase family 28 protein [Chitinophagaceae bacterium]